jgi:hypothetical protein
MLDNSGKMVTPVHAGRLQHFGGDRHGRINGIGNDRKTGPGAGFGAGTDQFLDDTRVHVEQVVARHAWLARHAGRDHHDIGILHRGLDVVTDVAGDTDVGRDMAQVDRDPGGERRHVVKRQFAAGGELQLE